jgi:hypothetical protein
MLWGHSRVLWGTLGYSGVLWGTLGYSGVLTWSLRASRARRHRARAWAAPPGRSATGSVATRRHVAPRLPRVATRRNTYTHIRAPGRTRTEAQTRTPAPRTHAQADPRAQTHTQTHTHTQNRIAQTQALPEHPRVPLTMSGVHLYRSKYPEYPQITHGTPWSTQGTPDSARRVP